MAKTIEHVHWPDAPDMWMPYAPAIKVTGGTTVHLAGVTAAPVYHHHPHRPEEFDTMPADMEGQARAALENLKRGLDAIGRAFEEGVCVSGCTVHLVDPDLDTGPIIAQRAVERRDGDTVDEFEARIHDAEHVLYPRAVRRYLTESWRRAGKRLEWPTSMEGANRA